MNFKNLFKKKKKQFTVSEVIKRFGEDLSYKQAMAILPSFPKDDQIKITNEIYKKQQDFWNSPNVVKYYAKIYPNSPFVPNHFSQLTTLLSPKSNEVIIDLGCGCGVLIQKLFGENKNTNFKIVGIDYSAKALERASKLNSKYLENGRLKLINHDFRLGIPFSNESTDKIVSNWGIFYFHQEDLKKALLEVRRVLKPEGTFLCAAVIKGRMLSLFQKRVIKTILKDFLMRELKEIKDILREGLKMQKNLHSLFPMYSEKEILKILEEAHFEIKRKEYSLLGASIVCLTRKN